MNSSVNKKVTKNPLQTIKFIVKLDIFACTFFLFLSIVPNFIIKTKAPIENYAKLIFAFGIIGGTLFLYLYRKKSRFAWHVSVVMMIMHTIRYPLRFYDLYFNGQESPIVFFILLSFGLVLIIYAVKQKSSYKEFLMSQP